MEKVSIREYARRRGVSETAVRKAVKAGKIVEGYLRDEKNEPWIIPDVADKEWKRNHNPNYDRNPNLQKDFADDTAAPKSGASIADLKRAESALKVKKLKLEVEEKEGTLVNKAEVYRELYAFGQQIREAIQAIPSRVTDDMLAAPTRVDAQTILENEIASVLERLSDTPKSITP